MFKSNMRGLPDNVTVIDMLTSILILSIFAKGHHKIHFRENQ